MSDVTAITLTDEELLAILAWWESPADFVAWQRQTLADEIMRRAQTAAQDDARQIMQAVQEQVQETFPTLFEQSCDG